MDAEKEFPYLTIAARLARPDTNNQMLYERCSSPSMQTLSFSDNKAPTHGLRAEDGYKCIYLSWQHPEQEDHVLPLFRSTDGTSFRC